MKQKTLAILILIVIIILDIVMADNLFPIYVRNRDANTIIELEINYTTDIGCTNVLLSDVQNIAIDNKGVGFMLSNITSLETTPSYICEYEDDVLMAVHQWNDIFLAGNKIIFNDVVIDNLKPNELNISGSIVLQDDNILYMSTDKTKYIQYNNTLSGFLIGNSEDVLISSPDDVFITAGIGDDGSGSFTPAIALEDDFLYLDASGDSSEYIWLSSYAYTRFQTQGDVRFETGGDSSDYIIINTTNNVPYISTVGNSDLRLDSSSGLVNVSANLSANLFGDGTNFYTISQLALDTNASTACNDGYYLDGNGFCSNFNDTVKRLFTELQIVYNATSINTEVGTLDSGNLLSVQGLADDDTYNISEVSGAVGFLININFTNVINFNTVALRGMYDGGAGHTLALELYRVGVGWEEREEITDQMDWGVTTFPVFIGSNFIDNGIVQLRINHDDNGIIAHNYFLDAVFIGQVQGLVSGGDLADLTGRDNACVLLPDVFCKDGSKNMTGQLNGTSAVFTGALTTGIITAGELDVNGVNIGATSRTITGRYGRIDFDDDDYTEDNQNFIIETIGETAGALVLRGGGDNSDVVLDGTNKEVIIFSDWTATGQICNDLGTVTKARIDLLGVGIATPEQNSKLHLRASAVAGASYDTNTVLFLERNDHAVIMIVTPSNKQGLVGFADEDDTFMGGIIYDNNVDNLHIYSNNAVRMTIDSAGSFFLPDVYDDDIGTERDLLIQADGQIGYDGSSSKFKENIKNITTESEKIYNLNPRIYDRISGKSNDEIGLIAEEVNLIMPEIISYKRNIIYETDLYENDTIKEIQITDEPETVNTRMLIVPMLKELQKLNDRLIVVEQDNKMLKDELCKKDNTHIWC